MTSRAPVLGDDARALWRWRIHPLPVPRGWIDWAEHLSIFAAYARRYRGCQTAARIAGRGGFHYREIETYTGAAPTTWRPRDE